MALNPIQVVGALTTIFQKPQVTSVATHDAHKAAVEVSEAIKHVPEVAIVPVKPAITSKINWTQFIGVAAMLASYFGLPLTADQLAGILAAIGTAQGVITWVIKTWFTNSVTPSSAGKT